MNYDFQKRQIYRILLRDPQKSYITRLANIASKLIKNII